MDENQKTVDSYNLGALEYVSNATKNEFIRDYSWLTSGLNNVPKDAAIFEIGSGVGFEADVIENMGYVVQRSDAAVGFVDYLKISNKNVVQFNILTDSFPSTYDVILANMVLLHFNRNELKNILYKIHSALKPGGRLLFTVRSGEGEEWKEKPGGSRYFCYWQKENLNDILSAMSFSVTNMLSLPSDKTNVLAVCAEKVDLKHES